MKVSLHKRFVKQFEKLQPHQKNAVTTAILAFRNNPHDPSLYNHSLKGALAGHRSISAGFDLRLVFREEGGYIVVEFLRVGTHSQLYGS